MLSQAVILAGGLGKRLGEVTKTVPKPMIDVGGRPFLETLILHLKYYGFKKIIITVGYLAEIITTYFGDGSRYGLHIIYANEQTPSGTGGFLSLFKDLLNENFLVINGDTIFDVNYYDLYQLFKDSNAQGAIALRQVSDTQQYGSVELNGELIISFDEKGRKGQGLVNGGIYLFKQEILQYVNKIPFSLEIDLMYYLIDKQLLVGRSYPGFFIDIGVPESLAIAHEQVPSWWNKPIVFLDRDGVINKDHGYVCSQDRFQWTEQAPEAIRFLNEQGFRVVVITNQAGIARGYYDEIQFSVFMDWIQEELKNIGAHIDAVYYCPHHPTEGLEKYRQKCDCRKPEPGLLIKAIQEFRPLLEQSFMIGDKESDLQVASRVGLRAYHFNANWNLLEFIKKLL